MRPSWNMAHHLQLQQQLQSQQQVATYMILQLDKATQTDESYMAELTDSATDVFLNVADTSNNDFKIGKVIRERLQGVPHSVSSQTLSPVHGNDFPFFSLYPSFLLL